MQYTMKVTIYNPETPEGMTSDLLFELACHFHYDPNQYGNGHYLSISAKGFNKEVLDLRYDTSFDRNNKIGYLATWATNYWSGKNGAYSVKDIAISKA